MSAPSFSLCAPFLRFGLPLCVGVCWWPYARLFSLLGPLVGYSSFLAFEAIFRNMLKYANNLY